MSDWFQSTPESERMLAEERLILDTTECIHEAMDVTGVKKNELAKRLGISKSEIGQRLSGRRNLTIRSLAATLHALGYEARLVVRPARDARTPAHDDLRVMRQKISTRRQTTYRTTQTPATLIPSVSA